MASVLQKGKDDLRIAMRFASQLGFNDLMVLQRFCVDKLEESYIEDCSDRFNPYKHNTKHG